MAEVTGAGELGVNWELGICLMVNIVPSFESSIVDSGHATWPAKALLLFGRNSEAQL